MAQNVVHWGETSKRVFAPQAIKELREEVSDLDLVDEAIRRQNDFLAALEAKLEAKADRDELATAVRAAASAGPRGGGGGGGGGEGGDGETPRTRTRNAMQEFADEHDERIWGANTNGRRGVLMPTYTQTVSHSVLVPGFTYLKRLSFVTSTRAS